MQMTQPHFMIIGTMKGGTTLLWDALDQHPAVFMSTIKEPHYFSTLAAAPGLPALEGDDPLFREQAAYAKLFAEAQPGQLIGEASTSYLHTPGTAAQIYAALPAAKLICILRNPIDRAYSHYLYLVRKGVEDARDFESALAQESARTAAHVPFGRYGFIGLYHQHLREYLRYFAREQIYICRFEELTKQPSVTYPAIFNFLGIDPNFTPDTSVTRNPSGVPKNRWLDALITRPNPVRNFLQPRLPRWLYRKATQLRDQNLTKPTMLPATRASLGAYYQDEIFALGELLEKDLTPWLQIPSGGQSSA
jgi:hypothetical protein